MCVRNRSAAALAMPGLKKVVFCLVRTRHLWACKHTHSTLPHPIGTGSRPAAAAPATGALTTARSLYLLLVLLLVPWVADVDDAGRFVAP